MSKQHEIAYLSLIGESGRQHAAARPFSDHNCGLYLARIGQVMSLLPPAPARILDMGCGTGWTSTFLARAGYEVVGVDIAPDMIEAARHSAESLGLDSLTFDVADYEGLDASEEFDAVVFFDSLHHAEDEQAALSCAHRALRPGGTCVTSEPGAGHHKTAASRRAIEEFGVNEKEMPPMRLARVARAIGFSRTRTYPHAGQLHALLNLPPDANRGGLLGWALRTPLLRPLIAVAMILGMKHRSGVMVLVK